MDITYLCWGPFRPRRYYMLKIIWHGSLTKGKAKVKKKKKKWEKLLQTYSSLLCMTIHFKLIFCFRVHNCIGHNVIPARLGYHITSFSNQIKSDSKLPISRG